MDWAHAEKELTAMSKIDGRLRYVLALFDGEPVTTTACLRYGPVRITLLGSKSLDLCFASCYSDPFLLLGYVARLKVDHRCRSEKWKSCYS